ncbi:MAG: hypothetical protein JWN54_467 [Mycobacterium sp.]|nr:hypothetical protein [Mycobacterium sp.]
MAAVVVAVAGSAVVALAGCGGAGERGRAESPSPSSPDASSPSTSSPSTLTPGTPTTGAPAPGVLTPIRYARSGGLAGMDDVLVISPDGTLTLTSRRPTLRRTGRLTDAERSALAAAMPPARGRDGARRLDDPHPDAFVYTVTYDTAEFRFTGAGAPPELADLVRTLRGITGRLGRTF